MQSVYKRQGISKRFREGIAKSDIYILPPTYPLDIRYWVDIFFHFLNVCKVAFFETKLLVLVG